MLESFWDDFEIVSGSSWVRFGIGLGSFCDRFGIGLEAQHMNLEAQNINLGPRNINLEGVEEYQKANSEHQFGVAQQRSGDLMLGP